MMDSHVTEESNTRQGSKLSLGSSPSALSADEQLEGEGPLTPTDKLQDDEEDEEVHNEDDDDDDLSALNSILQAGSAGSLSDEEEDDEEDHDDKTTTAKAEEEDDDEQDSASPLSSVPDDFPLSRSASPELPLVEPLSQPEPSTVKNEKRETEKKPATRKRRKDSLMKTTTNTRDSIADSHDLPESKRPKLAETIETKAVDAIDHSANEEEDMMSHDETNPKNKRRRVSRSSLVEVESRTRRRQSKDGPVIKKEEDSTDTADQPMDETPKRPLADKSNLHEHQTESPKAQAIRPEDELEETDETKDKKKKKEEPIEQGHHESHDDHDYQQRHKEALDALTHIEVEFARLRDKMYQEKMSELNEEAIMIANGTHPELVTLMAEIEEKKGRRIHSAEAWRRYQHANFRQQFEGFEYQANIHFISQRNALRRQLLEQINGKRWSIEDERSKLNDPSKNGHLFPDGREMIAHKRELKEETGELQDIKEAIGFPMAPNPSGLNAHDLNEDLKLLGIHRY
ncbi:Transcriptional regulatory protein dep1 [Choanephora cucurbitarum]|uniref:Transcriptional regulatory protein dep1 n=1 Tax=Choanephora cucurbitarum TaxID=101091 RepID=A0A1C7NQV4_9FUNG|nr:Transcriptional regulatory protein dep1 [Choanephora cucurbitarum]